MKKPAAHEGTFRRRWRETWNQSRILPAASPRMLAFVRIVVCSILLASALWENLPSTTLLPAAMREPLGVLKVLEAIPGFAWLCRDATALAVLQGATCAALFLALIGLRTRLMALLGALLYLVLAGLLREYAWFYHTGLVPLYALFVLAVTPCGRAWSVDRWRARRARPAVVPDDTPRLIDAWSVYAVWIVVAVPYVLAGLSKVRAGWEWFHPHSFKSILLTDALQPMQFGFDFTRQIIALPEWLFTVLAIGAVAGEIAMGAVLLWPGTRRWLPLMMVAMHVAICLLQRVLFFDLILIQAIFLAPASWFTRGGETRRWPTSAIRWPRPILWLLAGLGVMWVTRSDWYPLTDMHMYTTVNRSGTIRYPQLVAQLASGVTERARPEEVILAMRDARYRRLLSGARKEGQSREIAAEFFARVGALENASRAAAERIIAYEVVWKRWDFVGEPGHPEFGNVDRTVRFEVAEPARALASEKAENSLR